MSDGLSWAAAIDTTQFDNGLNRIEQGVREAASNIEFESERIQSLFTDIPEININAVTNMPQTADEIGEAYAEIARVTRINEEAINELSQEYYRLTEEINKFQNVPSKRDEVAKWREEKKAIKENIELRREMIAKTEELTKVVDQNAKEFDKHQKTQNNVKLRIREVMQEMAALRNEAQMNGQEIDESTGRYRELAEELGRLKDIQGDVATQAKILSNDENQFQGVLSGLSGLSGGFTAAQGAMALFGAENENLQKVMTQLQAVMAITMGLQQVQQMLNKDSAFRLVTLNSLRSLWNKLMGESNTVTATNNAVTATNNAETETNVAATEAQANATTTATASEEANTTAQIANNTATKAGTTGTIANTTATEGATVAQNANTASLAAATTATKAATVATKLFRLAIASTGIGLLIIGIGALVSWVMELIGKEDEATQKAKELREVNEEGGKAYAKAKGEISGYISKIEKFNGTQKEEKRLLKEVNDKYGEQFGYAKDLKGAKNNLVNSAEAYCQALATEAKAQAFLNKYIEAYINLLQVQADVKAGKYHHWYNTKRGDEIADKNAIDAAQADADAYLTEYQNLMLEAQNIRAKANIGGHTDPSSKSGGGKGGKGGDSFDPKAAARQRKEALNQWKEAVKQYIKEANAEVNQANIDAMEDGMDKEIQQLQYQTKQKAEAWKQHLLQLATAYKASEKAYYMSQKGHTEEGWEASDRGKMSVQGYADELLTKPENAEFARQYYARLTQITETGEERITDLRKKYQDNWIKDYGSDLQKAQLLQEEWNERLKKVMLEAPELYSAVEKAMEQDMAKLDISKFKLSINWDDVFGNLNDQSLQSLQLSLDKVKTYFAKAKGEMSVTEIKDFQEAITKMEDEIASRNPFTALHKSFHDISTSKTELVDALGALKSAQDELNAASQEYNQLFAEKNRLAGQIGTEQPDEMFALEQAQERVIESEKAYQKALSEKASLQEQIKAGTLSETDQDYIDTLQTLTEAETARNEAIQARNEAQSVITDQEAAEAAIQLTNVNNQLADSTTRLATAQKNNVNAEQKVITARNNVTKSYKQFATNLEAAGGVVTDIGGKAKNLARIFSDDVADSMEKSLTFIDEVMDATADVISAIGDVGKSVAKGMTQTVDAMGTATKSTAAATATSISTVEKASIILTVISAALQIATAIANLFNNDDSKQKEIERLQERIDQLQWELSNADTVRLQKDSADAMQKLSQCYQEAYDEVLRLNGVTRQSSWWVRHFTAATHSAEIYTKSVEKIADYWAQVDYTAGKALGSRKYSESRDQLKNLAEQQLLIQKQINEESSKKKSDSGKIQDYENQIAELSQQMADLINDMVEDIIGHSAEDLAKTLGDAFFDAVAQGEDAMEAWAKSTKDIVRDIIKNMLITKFLEEPIGNIFNNYKKKWFGEDGTFKGIDAVINSADDFANEINAVGESFAESWEVLSGSLGKWFQEDKDREGTSKGIATASQDSVDENNARLTTIQGHTYTLVQGVNELNSTANAMLDRLSGIEENTSETNEKLDNLDNRVKRMGETLETIQTSGLRLKK